jgi:hypothetical protein
MPQIKVSIQSIYCGDIEDFLGADNVYCLSTSRLDDGPGLSQVTGYTDALGVS